MTIVLRNLQEYLKKFAALQTTFQIVIMFVKHFVCVNSVEKTPVYLSVFVIVHFCY